MPDSEALEIRRKRLLYLSQHRGMKEADILIGGFAASHLAGMDSEQLDRYERLLEEEDAYILDWLMGRRPIPEDVAGNDAFNLLKQFKLV